MNAIDLLKQQHRLVEKLFAQFEKTSDGSVAKKAELCRKISDELSAHATIEEKIFYPACKDARTEDKLREALEEHLGAKRLIADLIELDAKDPQFEAKVKVLQEQIEHHVKEEEEELFEEVEKLLSDEELDDLGRQMKELYVELMSEGDARMATQGETDAAAPL
jgi:hemerythrin superfamily protein